MAPVGDAVKQNNPQIQEFDVETVQTDEDEHPNQMAYGVNDGPPWPSTILFALQQVMVCTTGIITDPLIVSGLICSAAYPAVKVRLISTVLFMSGIGTILQATLGIRLPLVQGASFAFITPIQTFAEIYACPQLTSFNETVNGIVTESYNLTGGYAFNVDHPELEWERRLSMVQGSLLAASLIQILLGGTGLVGVLLRFIGPLTTAPLMLLLSLSIVDLMVDHVATSWTSLVLMIALLGTALYGHPIKIPVPVYSRAKGGLKTASKPVFALFPYLLAIAFVWSLSAILTVTDLLPEGNAGRTDIHADIIYQAPWFSLPYPGQWGIGIDFHLGLFFGFVAATIASVVESVGDYHAIARVTNDPRPPRHATNRGIMTEGIGCFRGCIGCFIGALIGGGTSLTTYSENVGAVGITKVASRRPLQVAGIMLIVLGVFTKFGAIVATIPEPMIGAQLTISLGIVGGVGLSSIQQADMRLSRNMAILGISCILGMMLPIYVAKHPLWVAPETGIEPNMPFGDLILQALNTLFGIQMFVGGAIGCFLDNTVPGATRAQRGFPPETTDNDEQQTASDLVYGYSPSIMAFLNKMPILKHFPFMPMYRPNRSND